MSTKEKTDIAISLIVVLVALGFILYHTAFKAGNFLQSQNKESLEVPDRLEKDGKSYALYVTNQTDQHNESKSSIKNSDTPLNENNVVTTDTMLTQEQNDYLSQVDTINQVGNFKESEIDSTTNLTEQAEVEKNQSEKTSEIVEKNCIILVGSFSKKANADKVKKRLLEEEYEIFESSNSNLHRIGVYINCDSDVQYKELKYLSKSYAVDAHLYIEE